jgi:hypothetical protein
MTDAVSRAQNSTYGQVLLKQIVPAASAPCVCAPAAAPAPPLLALLSVAVALSLAA